jgi:hypothetical protein
MPEPKDLLAGFDGGESGMSPRLLRGNSINLFGVEYGVDAMDIRPRQTCARPIRRI